MAIDILQHIEDHLIQAGLDSDTVRTAIAHARQDLGGQRLYIRRTDPNIDRAIIQSLENKQHPKDIAQSVGRHRTSIVRRRSRWL